MKKNFLNIFVGGVAGIFKKCIFAVPFCAPGERCERERMRLGRRRGEGQDGPSSLNEWKDVANNSSCFLRASSDSYIQDEKGRGRDRQTKKERD